jgi:AcrR family transcriptional regulator
MQPARLSRPSPRIERTQQALLEALLELIIEQGYERTTVEDILRRADVGRTAFYSHFENKQDLLLNRFATIPWLRPSSDGTNSFDATFLFAHIADQRRFVAGLRGTPAYDEALTILRDQLLQSFTQLLEERTPPGEANSNLELTAQALTGALIQLLLSWLEAGMPEPPNTMANWFAQLAERMIDE